jgi:CheY-like chemotaxis protein
MILPSTPARRSVLVVDDEPDVLSLLSEYLGDEGFDVVGARDGIDALSYLYARRPAAVLIDLCMPRMDGLELIRQMRSDRALAGVAVVAMSGDPGLLAAAKEAGAQAALRKPFDPLLVLRTVRAQAGSVRISDAETGAAPS